MKYYLVIFDRISNKSYGDFHNNFTESEIIKRWFHYIKSSYIVSSYHDVDDISDHFTRCAENNNLPTTHLIVEVNLENRQGKLVDDAWKWIQRNTL